VRVFQIDEHAWRVDGRVIAMGHVPRWDDRNLNFLATAQAPTTRTHVLHRCWLPLLDQDDVGACVGFTGTDALGAVPLYRPRSLVRTVAGGNDHGFATYSVLTSRDTFAGTWLYNGSPIDRPHGTGQDTGTSLLSLCQFLLFQGKITRYEWVRGNVELLLAKLGGSGDDKGTVVLTGWEWTEGMLSPERDGLIQPTGRYIGNHATMLRGFQRRRNRVRLRNHWGASWGLGGEAELTIDAVQNRMDEGGQQVVLYR
jgi:hypothetical protein